MRSSRRCLDHYRTLGLSYNAKKEEIRATFREMAKIHHPDVNPKNDNAHRAFQKITEAHSVLSDEKQRTEYDVSIGNYDRIGGSGVPRDFRPEVKIRKSGIKVQPPADGGPVFNYKLWKESHYGDDMGNFSRKATEQVNDNAEPETPTMKYFARKNQRTAEDRVGTQEKAAVRNAKKDIVKRLKLRADARRAADRPYRREVPETGGCVVS